jgi:hypothetical protein
LWSELPSVHVHDRAQQGDGTTPGAGVQAGTQGYRSSDLCVVLHLAEHDMR